MNFHAIFLVLALGVTSTQAMTHANFCEASWETGGGDGWKGSMMGDNGFPTGHSLYMVYGRASSGVAGCDTRSDADAATDISNGVCMADGTYTCYTMGMSLAHVYSAAQPNKDWSTVAVTDKAETRAALCRAGWHNTDGVSVDEGKRTDFNAMFGNPGLTDETSLTQWIGSKCCGNGQSVCAGKVNPRESSFAAGGV
jgi:hypothetical protein